MEFQKIIYFLKIAEQNSFSKAARELYVSPQTLSRQIQELEQILGYPLFTRSTVKVELTDNGRAMYQRFAGLRDSWENAWNESILKKKIHLAFFPGILSEIPTEELLQYLTDTYPDWDVSVTAMDIPGIVENILAGELDFALTAFYDGEIYKGCCQIALRKSPALAYMPASHPLADRRELSMDDLLSTAVILVDHKNPPADNIFNQIAQLGHPVYIDGNLAIGQELQLNRGIALMPRTESMERYKGITFRPLGEDCRFFFNIGFLYKENHVLKKEFASVAQALAKMFP